MGITIDQILNMPVMQQARLIAGGEKARSRVVDAIAVLESPDSIRWLQRNNLAMSNTHVFKLYPKLFTSIVDNLLQRGASGIALKLGRHLQELPQEMIDEANRRHFPIIALPHRMTSSQIINAVTFEIYSHDAYDPRISYAENFLRELLVSKLDKHSLRNRALTLGWNLKTRMQVAVVEADGELDECFGQTVFDCGFSYLLRIASHYVAIADLREEDRTALDLPRLVQSLEEHNPLRSVYVGLGRPGSELTHLADSYREARIAVCMGMTSKQPIPVTEFARMGVYTILLERKNEGAVSKLFQNTVDVLEKHDEKTHSDCMLTVAVYLEENRSIERTAKRLYVHYNTVRYRLTKVHELLGTGLSQEEILLNLQIALRIRKCLAMVDDALQHA